MEQTEREKKEQAYITQLKKNMNPEDVAGLYHLYQKLTEKSYFRTDVGFGFLAELRDYLLKNGYQIDAYTMPQSQASGTFESASYPADNRGCRTCGGCDWYDIYCSDK